MMANNQKISGIDVWLMETKIKGNFADSTRTVGTIGFVVVNVRTDGGLNGIGVTYHEVGGEAIREFVKLAIEPKLIGRSPWKPKRFMRRTSTICAESGERVWLCAYSAVDIALWDLKGKMLGLPLYKLLGGNKTKVPVYASGGWTSYSKDELVAEAKIMVARGYDKIKVKVGVDGGRNLGEDYRRIQAVREAVGPNVSIMIDANNVWQSGPAVQFANRVRELDIALFEEPVFADDIPGLARFKQGTDIPLGTGEHEYTRYGFRDLVMASAVDVIQADIARVGGYTEMLKIVAISQAWNLSFAPHGMEHMHMHLVAATPNALFLERLLMFEEVVDSVFLNAPQPVNGMMEIPDTPGLGLELNMDNIRENAR